MVYADLLSISNFKGGFKVGGCKIMTQFEFLLNYISRFQEAAEPRTRSRLRSCGISFLAQLPHEFKLSHYLSP